MDQFSYWTFSLRETPLSKTGAQIPIMIVIWYTYSIWFNFPSPWRLTYVKDSKGEKWEVFPFGAHKTFYRLLLLQQQTMKEQCFLLNEESICSLDDGQKNQTKFFQTFLNHLKLSCLLNSDHQFKGIPFISFQTKRNHSCNLLSTSSVPKLFPWSPSLIPVWWCIPPPPPEEG